MTVVKGEFGAKEEILFGNEIMVYVLDLIIKRVVENKMLVQKQF